MVQPDKIIRSKRKSLAVSVDCFGKVIVRAPLRYPEEKIFAFLQEKESWILKKQAIQQNNLTPIPTQNLDGFTFPLLGKNCVIRLTTDKTVRFDIESYCIFLPENKAEKRLVGWLKENALRIFTQMTIAQAEKMQTHFVSVRVGGAKSKWGSCSYDNRIQYSFRLIYAPKEVIEYVVTHELCHIRHKNHSKFFWQEVEKYIPDFKAKRKWLKEHRILMQIF